MQGCSKDHDKNEEIMTDLQFLEYKRVRDELEAARREIEILRASRNTSDSIGMTDFQFKGFLELIYKSLKVRFESGKPQEEILSVVGDLIKGMGPVTQSE